MKDGFNDNDNRVDNANPSDLYLLKKFNWGAFLIAPLWCITYKRLLMGAIILTFIASSRSFRVLGIYNIMFHISILFSIYVGFTANKYLWKKYGSNYSSVAELIRNQRVWTIWGIALHILYHVLSFLSTKSGITT